MPHQHTGENIVTRAINWLRRGYPQGVPSQDNIAVLYVLKRHLSNEDIEAVSRSATTSVTASIRSQTQRT